VPFVEGTLGLGLAGSAYKPDARVVAREFDFGAVLRAEAGATVQLVGRVGAVLSAGYDYAPVLSNQLDETHNDGGFHFGLGLRVRSLSGG